MKCLTKAIKLLHEKDYDSYRIDSETIIILFFRTTYNFFNFYSNQSLKERFYEIFFSLHGKFNIFHFCALAIFDVVCPLL